MIFFAMHITSAAQKPIQSRTTHKSFRCVCAPRAFNEREWIFFFCDSNWLQHSMEMDAMHRTPNWSSWAHFLGVPHFFL